MALLIAGLFGAFVLALIWRVLRFAARLIALGALVALALRVTADVADPPEPPTSRARGTVVRVVDGDTLTVRVQRGAIRVRLLGLDRPTTAASARGGRACEARTAAEHVRRLAPPGTPVRIVPDRTAGGDRVRGGRSMAYGNSTPRAGISGEAQLRAGHARVDRHGVRRFSRLARYQRDEAAARAARHGSWRACSGHGRRRS